MKLIVQSLIAGLLLLTACKKPDLMRFSASDDIYFNYTSRLVAYDTVMRSFALTKATTDSVIIGVKVMGKETAGKRFYALSVDAATTTAVDGKHYTLPVADSFYVAGDTVNGNFKLYIRRPADLRDAAVTLFLELKPNGYFSTHLTGLGIASNPTQSATRLKITIDDILAQPTNWAASEAFLGTYSRKKLELMVSSQNLVLTQFYVAPVYTVTQLSNFARTMQTYLNQQKTAGNTVLENDGKEMKMGPSAQ